LPSTIEYPPGSEQRLPKNVFSALVTAEDPDSALKTLRIKVETILEQMQIRKVDRKMLYVVLKTMSLDKD
jgi:hypothetical protein